MSTAETTVQETEATPVDRLRAEFAKTLEPRKLRKRFPRGGLVGEYHVANKADTRKAAETQDDEFLLISCLDRILIEDPSNPTADEDGLVGIGAFAGKPGEDPIQFDHRLCDILGIPKGSPKEIALALYGGNDLQLAQHVGELAEWSLDQRTEAYTDFSRR